MGGTLFVGNNIGAGAATSERTIILIGQLLRLEERWGYQGKRARDLLGFGLRSRGVAGRGGEVGAPGDEGEDGGRLQMRCTVDGPLNGVNGARERREGRDGTRRDGPRKMDGEAD